MKMIANDGQAARAIIGDEKLIRSLPRAIFAHAAFGSAKAPNKIREEAHSLLMWNVEMLQKSGISDARIDQMREIVLALIERWIVDPDRVMKEMKDPEAFRG
jgi:hypothetical protein